MFTFFFFFHQIRQGHPDEWRLRSSKRYKTTRLLEQLELIAGIAMARTATFESAAFITAPEVIKLEFLRLFAFERDHFTLNLNRIYGVQRSVYFKSYLRISLASNRQKINTFYCLLFTMLFMKFYHYIRYINTNF